MTYKQSILLVMMACLLGGCPSVVAPPPNSVADYDRTQKADPQAYASQVILMHNMQRLMDADLKPADRVASLQVAIQLGGEDPAVRSQMAGVLSDPRTPVEVHQAILAFLLKKDYPDLAGYVVQAMPNLKNFSALHDSVLDWLMRHPTAAVLSEVVKLWSQEPDITGANEQRYRQVIERLSGTTYDEALLRGINTPGFIAPGPAIEVLAKRMSEQNLRQRILGPAPRTDDMAGLQTFALRFDYLPTNSIEYAAMIQAYRQNREMLDDAAKLAAAWHDESGYRFNIRDFHLLSRMAQDPLRTTMRRQQLLAALGQSINARQHAHVKPATSKDDNFWSRAEKLPLSDLWTMYLLSDLLSRPKTEIAINYLAEGDRVDTNGAWGGLVFYKYGQAEATKYPSTPSSDDLTYNPLIKGKRGPGEFDFIADQRDSLCRFICHFERAENIARCGPTAAEIKDAQANNYNAVIFTTINAQSFAAHYLTAGGDVISLGVFQLKK